MSPISAVITPYNFAIRRRCGVACAARAEAIKMHIVAQRIRVEITARNDYWLNAVFVEWEDQFPERRLEKAGEMTYLVEPAWLDDLRRVAGQVFGTVRLSPDDPGRRRLFRTLIPGGNRR